MWSSYLKCSDIFMGVLNHVQGSESSLGVSFQQNRKALRYNGSRRQTRWRGRKFVFALPTATVWQKPGVMPVQPFVPFQKSPSQLNKLHYQNRSVHPCKQKSIIVRINIYRWMIGWFGKSIKDKNLSKTRRGICCTFRLQNIQHMPGSVLNNLGLWTGDMVSGCFFGCLVQV